MLSANTINFVGLPLMLRLIGNTISDMQTVLESKSEVLVLNILGLADGMTCV